MTDDENAWYDICKVFHHAYHPTNTNEIFQSSKTYYQYQKDAYKMRP
jgi:hypothetical protein